MNQVAQRHSSWTVAPAREISGILPHSGSGNYPLAVNIAKTPCLRKGVLARMPNNYRNSPPRAFTTVFSTVAWKC